MKSCLRTNALEVTRPRSFTRHVSTKATSMDINRAIKAKIARIEEAVQIDPGQRGIGAFSPPPGELLGAAHCLARLRGTEETAVIITGFPCLLDFDPPTETDGPLGAVAIARGFLAATAPPAELKALAPKVVLATDDCNFAVVRAAAVAAGLLEDSTSTKSGYPYAGRFELQSFPPEAAWSAADRERFDSLQSRAATVVAIERAGPAADGGCYTMRGFEMKHLLAPLHRLLGPRGRRGMPLQSVGIGDGGNEVGCGKVYNAILASTVPNAAKIANVVPADYLIVCGVSNWGGVALAAATNLLCQPANEATWTNSVASDEQDQSTLEAMVAAGCRDGCSKELAATVDGMPFEKSLEVTRSLRCIFTASATDGSSSSLHVTTTPAAVRAEALITAAEAGEESSNLPWGGPPSPLAAYLTAHFSLAQLRTGFPLHFQAPWSKKVDRSAAQAARAAIRLPKGEAGSFSGQTSGLAPGFTQANLVAVPKAYAYDFLTFALRNPRSCPLLATTDPGNACPRNVVNEVADLRTDIPKYRVWRDGVLAEEVSDVTALWTSDTVGFLIGCSFSWEARLAEAGLLPRHMSVEEAKEEGAQPASSQPQAPAVGVVVGSKTVPMFRTTVPNLKSGPFGGVLVVSMRPYLPHQLRAVEAITSAFPGAHGGPVHWGDPWELGIGEAPPSASTGDGGGSKVVETPEARTARWRRALASPDFGDAVELQDREIPVFWACGVTPQTALMAAKLPFAITHAPGHMFVTDVLIDELRDELRTPE